MVFRDVTRVLMGQLPAEEFVEPYSASFLYLLITMATGYTLRAINQKISPEPVKTYVGIFLATVEMCAYFFEDNFIFKNFGSVALFVAVVVECFIANRTFFGHSENPCHAFTQFLEKQISVTEALIRIGIQFLAGLASYRFARMVWSLDMVPDHRERYQETGCSTDLNVMFLAGFLLEMGATLVDGWMGRQRLHTHPLLDEFVKLSTGALMIVMGINMTGMYFNPAMASGHTMGCRGTHAMEHFFVYWAGPFLGSYVAITLDQAFHVDAEQKAKDGKKKAE